MSDILRNERGKHTSVPLSAFYKNQSAMAGNPYSKCCACSLSLPVYNFSSL